MPYMTKVPLTSNGLIGLDIYSESYRVLPVPESYTIALSHFSCKACCYHAMVTIKSNLND